MRKIFTKKKRVSGDLKSMFITNLWCIEWGVSLWILTNSFPIFIYIHLYKRNKRRWNIFERHTNIFFSFLAVTLTLLCVCCCCRYVFISFLHRFFFLIEKQIQCTFNAWDSVMIKFSSLLFLAFFLLHVYLYRLSSHSRAKYRTLTICLLAVL